MSEQQELFSPKSALEAKAKGMQLAADKRKDLLLRVREKLIQLASARDSKTASADDAQRILIQWGYDSSVLGNAAGSLFRGWQFTGKWTASIRATNHARYIRVWRLK